ncbi:MAG: 2,3,4,5-tetrahydropyridine-2,6-dicarboxylate N-succinyltransferase [Spirochaetales bacterium]|nr:2,3,4,5-tetrahydropyridine-2,6-dicarboxylate N-succinyltransferase [Leptospiraceae bacterium]MCP5480480.1 2,3,4,5-tetrahydropyridine-2,6-dicarboxylate N-succinyltransferase [Spirochaetales bacterium]
MYSDLEKQINELYEDRSGLKKPSGAEAVREAVALLNDGKIRVASQQAPGKWTVHAWVKKAILLYFSVSEMRVYESGDLAYYDKIDPRTDHASRGVRVVPPGVCRYGAFVEPGAIMMPSYVNIGAYVSSGTMVDTWATVGSCAQIGKNVHLSGGVGIGGVLEPPQGQPVIIEDNAFLGSRAIVVEGVLIEAGAVLGANVTITGSTPIIDVTGTEEVLYRGRVPANSVVIPGMRTKQFPAGEFGTPCALIIGQRKESTDKKTTLEQTLREYQVSV